jgi:hypothetical protein
VFNFAVGVAYGEQQHHLRTQHSTASWQAQHTVMICALDYSVSCFCDGC